MIEGARAAFVVFSKTFKQNRKPQTKELSKEVWKELNEIDRGTKSPQTWEDQLGGQNAT